MEASENSESLSTHLAEQPMTKENSNLSVSPSSHTQLTSSGQKPRLKIGLAGRGRGRGGIARGRSSLKGFAKNDQETRPGGSLADASLDPTNPWPYSQGDSPRPGGSVGRMADHVELKSATIPGTSAPEFTSQKTIPAGQDLSAGHSPGHVVKPVTTSAVSQPSFSEHNIPSPLQISHQRSREASLPQALMSQSTESTVVKTFTSLKPLSYGPEYATLVFSSLPPSWTKSELEAYCESLGEDIEIESATEPEARNARVVLSGLTSEEISTIKTKTHKAKKCVFSVTVQSPSISRVDSRMKEASQIIPTSETTMDSTRSLLWTDRTSIAPTDAPITISHGDLSSESFSSQVLSRGLLPVITNSDSSKFLNSTQQEVPEGDNSHTLLFSSLPPELNKSELAIFCETRGENVEIKSLDILGGGKARAVVSGLTSEEISRAKEKAHKLKGNLVSMQFETPPSFTQNKADFDTPSSKECIIVVKNLPDKCEPDLLEMYFEKPKSGGTEGCIKAIKIIGGANVAHVTFYTSEVAAQVLSKDNHKLLGKYMKLERLGEDLTVQKQYELDKLFLQEIPAEVDDEYLKYYLAPQLNIRFEEIHIKRFQDVAVVTFNKEFSITECEQMISQIRSKPLRGATIKAELYKVCTSIRLANVTESFRYSEEFMTLYFESKNSGGRDQKKVSKVELLGNGAAIVFFDDPEDTHAVFQHSHSKALGEHVIIELNDQLCIAEHVEGFTPSEPAKPSSKTSDPDIASSAETCKLTVKPLQALSLNKDPTALDQFSDELRVKVDIKPKQGHIIATPTKRTPANWQEKWKAQVLTYITEKVAFKENIQISKECVSELVGHFSNLQNEAKTFVHEFYANSTKVSIAGDREIVDSAKSEIRKISDRYTITNISIPLSKPEFDFIAMVKLTLIKENYSHLEVSLRDNSLLVKGTIQSAQEFCQALEELKSHVKVPVPVGKHICNFLKDRGCQKLYQFVKPYSIAVHFNPELFFLCEPNEQKSAQVVMQKLQQLVTVVKHTLPKSFVSLQDNLEDFTQLCEELEQQNTVVISTNQTELIIVGFKEGVLQCKTHLLEYIKEKCTTEVTVPIETGIWRLLMRHMTDKWRHFTDRCRELEVACIQPTTDEDDNYIITFKGDRCHVDQTVSDLSSLQSKICQRIIAKNQPGTCIYFRSEKARAILDGIEARRKVAIEVTEADEEAPGLPTNTSLAKFDKKCTAHVPSGGKKIILYVGDITEFDKADVIVNAANEDLRHIGALALAIANKGGTVIQSDSDHYVKKRGKVDTGNVWMTENVGNLPCKALVHAVGPRWFDGKRKEEALLRKACLQSLRACHYKFRSIAFPAISSGIYGFPLKKCAETMLKAFIEYSKQHASSNIQEINLVLYKEADSSVFISTLQSQLPSSSIHIDQTYAAETVHPQSELQFLAQARTVPKGRTRKSKSSAAVAKASPIPIKLHKGGLLTVMADVYVNSTNTNLDLSQGAVARALLKVGGQQLQTECTAKAPLRVGEVAVTRPGKIPCKYIVHTVVANYDGPGGKAEKILRRSVRSCLESCSKLNVTSIAFPSIGTGNLRFPNNVTAKAMIDEIILYFSSNTPSSIKTIHLVIFMQDTYQAFQEELQAGQIRTSTAMPTQAPSSTKHSSLAIPTQAPLTSRHKSRRVKYSQPSAAPETSSAALNIGQLTLNVVRGDISEESTDTIVVPTNATMQLTGQGVAGAILNKGGQELQEICNSITGNGVTLSEGKVVSTPVTGALKSKALFHIVFESKDDKKFTKVIVACLQEADKKKYKSISFPAIGTGIHGYPPQIAAFGMYKAIEQNAAKLKHLRIVRIVLYPQDVYSTFVQVFQNPDVYETPGFVDRAKTFIESMLPTSVVLWSTSEGATPVDFTFIQDETNQEVVIRIYGETEQFVDNAETDIEKLIEDTFVTTEVENQMVSKLSRDEIIRLQSHAKDLHVYIDIDPEPLNTIKLKGDETNVHKMKCFAVELLSEVEKAEKQKEEADKLSKTIRWLRVDSNGDEEEYSIEENYEIEGAFRFRSGKGTYHHASTSDGTDFTIDFDKNEEVDHNKHNARSVVKRNDLLKKIQEEIPKHWEKMPIDSTTGKECLVHIVDLDKKSQEYQDIQRMFDASMRQQQQSTGVSYTSSIPSLNPVTTQQQLLGYAPSNQINSRIIKIQRIQNPTLYSQYIARKKEMDKLNPQGCQNERRLFHGTKPDTCPKINHGGFNRSYCGQNATVYGKGVYFARDAEYSARDTYSPRDVNGYKYIYLARVLTGEFTRGSGGMLVPPPKNQTVNAHIAFDSVVDNVANPGIFVVFQDAQNYPEYLITFQ